jgi:murein DD-endopeptidase MepM/ murein hydrolase activator NlpD
MSRAPSRSLAISRTFRIAGQISLLAIVAGLGAGCTNLLPIRDPVFTGSTANQKEILAGAPAGYGQYASVSSGAVQGTDLPPPAGASASTYAASAAPPQAYTPPQTYTPPQESAPTQLGAPPTSLGEQAARVDGGGAMEAGSATHLVQPGDTAWNISRRYGISVDQLMAANGGSATVKLGQKIAIPGATRSAPDAASTPQPRVQVAALDPAAEPPPPPVVAMTPAPAIATAPVAPAAEIIPPGQPQQAAIAPQTASLEEGMPDQPQANISGAFRWPVRGRVISGFGKKPNGERNDGINLAVPEGTEVKAAEDGTIIYAGNELKSYGNLVLIRHADGWVSAYAHNSDLKVKRGQEVRRGETIAISGMSGGVTTPQVHFELRKDATPVDPLQHLTES